MHEMSIVGALLEQVRSELDAGGHKGRVLRIDLVIGRLSGVHTDSIRFAFEALSPDTVAEGAELHVDEPRAECHCEACSSDCEIDELVIVCPKCDSPAIQIRGGRELLLQSIELEE